jgi:hypothetical protein
MQSPIQLDSTGAGTLVNDEDVVEIKPQPENPSAVVGTDSSVINSALAAQTLSIHVSVSPPLQPP